MFRMLKTRLDQGYRTFPFPEAEPSMPESYQGLPVTRGTCPAGCRACLEVCPTGAIRLEEGVPAVDLGRCVFCGACTESCGAGVLRFTRNFRMAASRREDLVVKGAGIELASGLDEKRRSLFGRSLKLRQVSAGGCNACEADTNVLGTLVFDLGRFGIQFVASPRHADGLLVTGPVTENMKLALEKTYEALPPPKVVIAVGACAISGGIYRGQEKACGGVGGLLPVDLFIPGCPPHPWTILDGLLRLVGRI